MKRISKIEFNAMAGELMKNLESLKTSQRNKWIKDHIQKGGLKEEDSLLRRRFTSIANHDLYRACLLLIWDHYKYEQVIIDAFSIKALMPKEWEEFYQLVKI